MKRKKWQCEKCNFESNSERTMESHWDKKHSTSPKKAIITGVTILVLVFLLSSAIVIVGAGERGVLLEFGRVTQTVFDEGLSIKTPIAQSVDIIDIKTRKLETSSSAASKDLQIVTSIIALNYRIRPDRVAWLRQNIGLDYQFKIIDPAIQESVKASTAKFTAEELITRRPIVREEMKNTLQEKLDMLSSNSIAIEEMNIVNFEFSEEFSTAIENKVTAEQLALKAERDLERIKIEAQQKIESAKAEAESIRIQSEALNENPDILQLRWIEKWNGIVPNFIAGGGTEGNFLFSLPSS